jgi:replicative DNA helicase
MATKIKITLTHEQVILGSMLSDRSCRSKLLKMLNTDTFISPRHRIIFAALNELEEKNLDYVPITLKALLPADEKWGGTEYLEKITKMGSPDNLDYHIQRAQWDRTRSQLLKNKIPELEAALKDPRLEIEEGLSLVKNIEDRLKDLRSNDNYIQGAAAVAQYMARLYARETGIHIRSSCYPTLDKKLTNPFGAGLLSIMAAAPSIGKTTLSLNMAQRQSKQWNIGYLAWESGHIAATDIICSRTLKIPLSKIIRGKLTRKEKIDIEELLEVLHCSDNQLSFNKRPPKSVTKGGGPWEINDKVLDWVDSQIEGWKRDIIYWDLFEKELPDRRPQAISWALDRAQKIAQKHNIHLVLLHQIRLKDLEERKDKRPTRGSLKGSGAYIEVPDFVFALYRDGVYRSGIEDNELDLFCLKQRIGPWPFRIIFNWEGKYCRVTGGREAQITVEEDDEFDI